MPDSETVSTASANPFVLKGLAAIALATLGVEVKTLLTLFWMVALVNAPVFTPASLESGQPSPSESRSKRFGIPSKSVSISLHE